MSKPTGIFIPKWEEIQDDPELDLRELLLWKRKRKEVLTPEPDSMPQCVKVRVLDDKIIYKLWRCVGLTCSTQGGLEREPQHKTLVCYVAQERSGEESNTRKEDNDRERSKSNGRRKAGGNRPGHRPTKVKTNFNKFKVVRGGKCRINPTIEGVQRCFCVGL